MNLQLRSKQFSIKHSAQNWAKESIDGSLAETIGDLKRYIKSADKNDLKNVHQQLRVVHGVLVMVEQYGAVILTEEMISLCEFIIQQQVNNRRSYQALGVLLKALLQLPDYRVPIELSGGDVALPILPLLQAIRATQKQDLFSGRRAFLPDLSMHQAVAEAAVIDKNRSLVSKQLIKKLQPIFELSLLNLIKEQDVDDSFKRLEKVFDLLEQRTSLERMSRIWLIVGALIESLSRQQLALSGSVKHVLGKIDALFRVLLLVGEAGLLKREPIKLIQNLLYYIARSQGDGPRSLAIKTAYQLEKFLPSGVDNEPPTGTIAAPNTTLFNTVAEALSVYIEGVKSALEIGVDGDVAQIDKLRNVPRGLRIIADTLSMLGLDQLCQIIEAQIITVEEILTNELEPNDANLSLIGLNLLQLEQTLAPLKNYPTIVEQAPPAQDTSEPLELDNFLLAVVATLLSDIRNTKIAMVEWLNDPKRDEKMMACITLIQQIRSTLLMLDKARAIAIMDGLIEYMKAYDRPKFMDANRLDCLSQLIVSLECYFEALGSHYRVDTDAILDFADIELAELLSLSTNHKIDTESDPIVAAEPAPAPELESDTDKLAAKTSILESESGMFEVIDIIAPMPQGSKTEDMSTIISAGAAPQKIYSIFDTELNRTSELIKNGVIVEPVYEHLAILIKSNSDPEILAIYLEEAKEAASSLISLQNDWLLYLQDEAVMCRIRRVFHKIKSSGRLVGAIKIAEFAQDYEQLLSGIIDATIEPTNLVVDAVGKAAVPLLELIKELSTGEKPRSDIPYLRGLARALAQHKATQVSFETTFEGDFSDGIADDLADDIVHDWSDDFSDERDILIRAFIDEANALLKMVEQVLRQWSEQAMDETGGFEDDRVMALQRCLHTFKGNAKIAELDEIAALSDELESMLIAIMDGHVEKTNRVVSLLKNSFKLLHQQVTEVQADDAISSPKQQIGRLQRHRNHAYKHRADRAHEWLDVAHENDADNQTKDVIQVRYDLFNNLVNRADAASLYQARMAHQVAGLDSHLGELGQAIHQIKHKISRLESEANEDANQPSNGQLKGDLDTFEQDRHSQIQSLSQSLAHSMNNLSSLQSILGEQVKDSQMLLLQQPQPSLPADLTQTQMVILVRIGAQTYAIPLVHVEGVMRVKTAQLVEQYQQPTPELEYLGQYFDLYYLATLMGTHIPFKADNNEQKQPILFIQSDTARVALHVDEILGNKKILVKPLRESSHQLPSNQAAPSKSVCAISLLPDGDTALVIDINQLVDHGLTDKQRHNNDDLAITQKSSCQVMVVDDSVTMRRLATKLLESHGYEVITAKDGVDAMAQLKDITPDLMLLDIEMPRMNGFELAMHMQDEPQYAKIPIIMITSRTDEKYRNQADKINIASYMHKPYQEHQLISNIQSVLESVKQ